MPCARSKTHTFVRWIFSRSMFQWRSLHLHCRLHDEARNQWYVRRWKTIGRAAKRYVQMRFMSVNRPDRVLCSTKNGLEIVNFSGAILQSASVSHVCDTVFEFAQGEESFVCAIRIRTKDYSLWKLGPESELISLGMCSLPSDEELMFADSISNALGSYLLTMTTNGTLQLWTLRQQEAISLIDDSGSSMQWTLHSRTTALKGQDVRCVRHIKTSLDGRVAIGNERDG